MVASGETEVGTRWGLGGSEVPAAMYKISYMDRLSGMRNMANIL